MAGFRDMAFENEAWGHGDGQGDVDSSEPESDDDVIDPRRRGPIGDITQNRSGSFSCRFCPNALLLSEKDVAGHLQGAKHRKRFKAWQKDNRTDEQKEQYRAAKRARRKRKAAERADKAGEDGGEGGGGKGRRRRKRGRRPGGAGEGGAGDGSDASGADKYRCKPCEDTSEAKKDKGEAGVQKRAKKPRAKGNANAGTKGKKA